MSKARKQPRLSTEGIGVVVPLLVALFLAPLAFGGTTRTTGLLLDGLCFAGLLLWIGRHIGRKTLPRVPGPIWIPLVLLSLIAVVHALFPLYSFVEKDWSLSSTGRGFSWLPGTVDSTVSREALVHFLALAGALPVLSESLRHRRIRWWFLRVLALSGFTVALIGIGQKAGAAEQMLWVGPEESGHLFFGAFRYHGNAAAYLNLCWPAALALWLRRCHITGGEAKRSFWMVAFLVTVTAVFVNSSKAGHLIACLFLLIAIVRFWKYLPLSGRGPVLPVTGAAIVLFFAAIAVVPGAATSLEKWDEVVSNGDTWKGRLDAWWVCLHMIPDAGMWGNGPGTFRIVFPFYTSEAEGRLDGFWFHAHQDYLQTWIEWGWSGVLLFGLIVGYALRQAFARLRSRRRQQKMEISTTCALLGFGSVAVHAFADFPLQIPAIQIPVIGFLAVFIAARSRPRRVAHHSYTTDARMQHPGVNRVRRDLEKV